ncbi:aldehyde dehydrogenase [Micractinium conductrix]|uniref:Aldehyde dehydrogenase n=1 Tax=Micractinium conductrix TaxID=554055 RepID=A0A2P6VNZ0_9CHLO|nr:aldehyde dehydrogenase [Micractinium conductrix]|eukprot:PSC75790.1 aldehyde dehydrogenase [Micractinium conductrix]
MHTCTVSSLEYIFCRLLNEEHPDVFADGAPDFCIDPQVPAPFIALAFKRHLKQQLAQYALAVDDEEAAKILMPPRVFESFNGSSSSGAHGGAAPAPRAFQAPLEVGAESAEDDAEDGEDEY